MLTWTAIIYVRVLGLVMQKWEAVYTGLYAATINIQ